MITGRSLANLSLVGFMGAGKSTVGRYVAGRLRYRFVDTDSLIEQRTGRKIQEIFATGGEAEFRAIEHELTGETAQWERTVIATGGGLITFGNNLDLLRKASFVICLWASADTIYRRVRGNRNRPLLQTEDLRGTIDRMLKARAEFYKRSDLIINTDNRSLRMVVQQVLRQYRKAFADSRAAVK